MKKRHKHEKKSKKSLLLVNIILFLACIIAGAILFFTLKESHSILSAEKTEQISKKSDQQTSTTPSTEQTSVNQANDNNSEVNWVQQDSDVSLPILMYHAIHVMAPEEASNANLIVDPTTFESHIKRVSDEGYYFLTPEEAYKVLTENVLPNGNPKIIWLTFDDSLWDFYDNAYPILKKYKAKATNNVITSTVGN
ncbi:polysaccharide deacetylase family protein, partial [Streptococcus vicugnae]